jgi:hypothetical protein
MRRLTWKTVIALLVVLCIPALALAGGDKANELVVVADTRLIDSSLVKYIANLYNFNQVLFATWAVILTAAYGCFLGVLMDFIMSRTGLDLKSRKIVEH